VDAAVSEPAISVVEAIVRVRRRLDDPRLRVDVVIGRVGESDGSVASARRAGAGFDVEIVYETLCTRRLAYNQRR